MAYRKICKLQGREMEGFDNHPEPVMFCKKYKNPITGKACCECEKIEKIKNPFYVKIKDEIREKYPDFLWDLKFEVYKTTKKSYEIISGDFVGFVILKNDCRKAYEHEDKINKILSDFL